jgi:transketolase
MPNWNLYERQSPEYMESVLPNKVRARVAIEAGSTFGWSRFVGLPGDGAVIGMHSFGASGKVSNLLEEFGLTTEATVKAAKALLQKS